MPQRFQNTLIQEVISKMNPIDVFLTTHSPLNGCYGKPVDHEVVDGELYLIDFNPIRRIIIKSHIHEYPAHSTPYNRIKMCFEERARSTKQVFVCRCGDCHKYLLTKMYELLFNTAPVPSPIPVVKPSSPKLSILEESLDELFEEEEKEVTATGAQTKIIATNPLDGAVITFGKYKGRTFNDVFDLDRSYCLWCIESSAIKQFVEPHKKPLQNMILFVHYAKQKFTS